MTCLSTGDRGRLLQLRLLIVAVSISLGPRKLVSAADYNIGLILEPLSESLAAEVPRDAGAAVTELDFTLYGLPAPAISFELAVAEINSLDTLLNGSTLHIVYNSSEYSSQTTRRAALWQITNANPVAFFGTWYYETTEALATISSAALIPHISSMARADDLSDDSKYPTFVRATAGDSSIANGLVALCQHFGWDRVAVLHAGNAAGSTLAQRLALRAVDVGIAEMNSFPYATSSDPTVLGDSFRATMQRLKASPHKIVILDLEVRYAIGFFAYWFSEGMHRAGYTLVGTEQWTADFFDLYNTFQPSIKAYTDVALRGLVYLSSDPAAARNATGQQEQQQRPEAARYEALVRARYDNNETRITNERALTPTALRTWDSAFLIARAIQALEDKGANVRDGPTLLDEILRTSFVGASGTVELDPDQRQLEISWNLLSWEISAEGITNPGAYVGSFDAASGTISLVKDITWADGTTNVPLDRAVVATAGVQLPPAAIVLRQTSPDVQLAAIVIAAVGAFVVLGHGIGLYAYRKTPIFRAASSSLLWLVLLGALCGLASAVVITLDFTPGSPIKLSRGDVDTLCKVQPFVLGSAFVLTFGVLLATAHRITSIFRVTSSYSKPKLTSKAARSVVISDRQLLVAVFALWLVDTLINVAWLQSGDLALSSQNVTSTIEYNSCGSADTRGWLWVSIAYKAVLLVATLFKATATRNVPAAFNSSAIVAVATYNVVIFSLVSIPLSLFAAENVDFAQPFRVAALGFCSLIIVGMLIGRNVFVALFTPEKNRVDGTSSGRASGSRVSRVASASASGGLTGGSSSSAVELPRRYSKAGSNATQTA